MDLRQELEQSTARIRWSELKSDILKDVIILVSNDLNLIDVALACALDQKEAFENWLNQGKVIKTGATHHNAWAQRNPVFECCMTKPFIFIQEILLN